MDKEEYKERVLSILRSGEGNDEYYKAPISKFKEHLNDAALAEEKLRCGWVLWRENERYEQQQLDDHSNNTTLQIQHKIIHLLKYFACEEWYQFYFLAQFWGVGKVEGRYHYLSTSHHPFSIPSPSSGIHRYRKLCMDHVYVVDEYVADQEEQQLGGVGRAYRNKQPEFTPDLRLYSTDEFPLRDEAARCGFIGYLALPLFDLHQTQCYGVLELLSICPNVEKTLSVLYRGLKVVELRSTHINFNLIGRHAISMPDKYKKQPREITEILELAIKVVPRLSLAQVWVPCMQCANISTNLCCMERASFITSQSKIVNMCTDIEDEHMFAYVQACEFHNLQIDLNCLRPNLCDRRISKNPLAHHAARAKLFLCFPVWLQSVNNSNYLCVIEFFLQPKRREDACGDSSLRLIFRIIEMKLRSFILGSREQLQEELVVQSRQTNAFECESIDMLNVMNSCMEFHTAHTSAGEKLITNVKSNSLLVSMSIKEKIKEFMKKIKVSIKICYWIVQFWAPKMTEGRCYLETSDQLYALGYLAKGLASFRKECMKHHYFVDDEAKEDELGPPGRVFRNGHPEITPDLSLYSTKEFPMRNYAVHCGLTGYFALPVFEDLNSKCVGVLEFVGLNYDDLVRIQRALKAATLLPIHINFQPQFNAKPNIIFKKEALVQLKVAFSLIKEIPLLHMAKVWVPYNRCASIKGNLKCMELALTTKYNWKHMHSDDEVHWIHVEPNKGIIGMVLESESKSCFCQNLSEFSIVDQPLAHYHRRERFEACFAICLQSSHTGDFLYVLEFFLNPRPEYLHSILKFLLPIMKHQLKSFKIASGKQLGEELVVEVIKFSQETQLTSSESDLPDVFPLKFQNIQYGQKEHQYAEEHQEQSAFYATQTEQSNVNASDLKITRRGKMITGLEVLEPHFGKKLEDVAEELGVGRSTIKRACRDYGIDRWPNKVKHTRNPSLFQHDLQPSTSNNLQPLDTSLHPNVAHANTETTQHHIVQEETEKVIIKVKFEEDIIKFELCLKLGLAKLFEEVATRLKLEMGSFKLKYLDEDDDEILLTCDADLQYCSKSQITMGKTYMQLFVR